MTIWKMQLIVVVKICGGYYRSCSNKSVYLRGESVSFTELEARFEDRELPIPKDLLTNWHCQADTETALQELVIKLLF